VSLEQSVRTDVQLGNIYRANQFLKTWAYFLAIRVCNQQRIVSKRRPFLPGSELPSYDVYSKMNVSSLARQIYRVTIFTDRVKGFLM